MNKNQDRTHESEILGDSNDAQTAYAHAISKGYTDKEVNIILVCNRCKNFGSNHHTAETAKGVAIGSVAGGTLGGIIAAAITFGTSFTVPGLGLVIAGPVMAGLAGIGAGSLSGGMMGALIAWDTGHTRH